MADENRKFFTRLAQLPTLEKQSIKALAKSSNQQQLEGESRASNVESQLRSCLLKDTSPEVNNEVPRLEFPSFEGVNPRNWFTKCSRYFALYKIPESQRVEVASLHLVGRAAAWFASYIAIRKYVDWTDFILDIYNRFKDERGSRVIEDFPKLHQTGQNTLCTGNHIPIDAPQALDKSPKSNPDISSHGWVGVGQGKSPMGSYNAIGERLEGLNPSSGLLEKSLSTIHDKDCDLCEQEVSKDDCCDEHHPLADARQVFDESPSVGEEVVPLLDHFQQPPDPNPLRPVAHPFQQTKNSSGENPKKNAHAKPETEWPATSVVVYADCGSLLHANSGGKGLGSVAEQVPFQELGLSGCKSGYEGIKVFGQCYELLLTLSAPRMEGGCASPLVNCPTAGNRVVTFDELLLSLQGCFEKLEHSYLIGKAHGCCLLIFDPRILGAGQRTPQARSLVCICAWHAEIFAAFKPPGVRLVFDPGAVVRQHLRSCDCTWWFCVSSVAVQVQGVVTDVDELGLLAVEPRPLSQKKVAEFLETMDETEAMQMRAYSESKDIVTRRPLVLPLHKTEEGSKEYAEFLHSPKRRFTDWVTGKTTQISPIPIHLSISPLDLPALTKMTAKGQPESIVQDMEDLVRTYAEKPSCIILTISPANHDMTTFDALKLTRKVDPSSDRAFDVLTKLALMDKGTNVLDVLERRAYTLQHPWVGIVNRSQAEINRNVDMMAARRKEHEYSAPSPDYSHLVSRMGSEYFAKLLSKHLESVVRARIPSITSLINTIVDELEDRLGRPVGVDAGAQLYTILELCCASDKVFKEHLDGGRPGGARTYGVFDNQLSAPLRKLPFDRYLSLQNVKKVVSEAAGYQPHLLSPEQGYRRLIEGTLNYFTGPGEASVDAVHFATAIVISDDELSIRAVESVAALTWKLGKKGTRSCRRCCLMLNSWRSSSSSAHVQVAAPFSQSAAQMGGVFFMGGGNLIQEKLAVTCRSDARWSCASLLFL